jgi:hypothetical protein
LFKEWDLAKGVEHLHASVGNRGQFFVTGESQPNPQLTIISSPPPTIVPTNFRYGNRSSRCTSYTGAEHTGSGRIGGSRPQITVTPSDTPKQRISEGYPLQISVSTEDGIPWSGPVDVPSMPRKGSNETSLSRLESSPGRLIKIIGSGWFATSIGTDENRPVEG